MTQPASECPRPLHGPLKRVVSTGLTLAVIGTAGAVVVFGSNMLAERAGATVSHAVSNLVPVSVSPIIPQAGYEVERRFIGQIEPRLSVPLSFELGGRVDQVLVAEGAAVAKGQIIARLDTALLDADRARLLATREALEARQRFAQQELMRNASLLDQGFASQAQVDQARASRDELDARIAETVAAVAAIDIRLEKSVLTAPFTGRIGAHMIDGVQTVAAGQVLMTLLDDAAPELRVGLPLGIQAEGLSTVTVDVADRSYPARLVHIRPDIDPVTRTRTAIFRINAEVPLTFGQTAAVIVPRRIDTAGFWVPLDALNEGTGGIWTVLLIDGGDTVRSAAVEVLHAEAGRVFVRGAVPADARLIDSGAHRVTPGQTVRPEPQGG
ncbi:MAG: efflux RND transporter periplasmic adaptor subunit [Rhodobacteraceae bacterium]|nr:efflux RND transporter periplasmic adaptor subunit [Paracoccaceae bacterium]